jgi:hypothetical protein
MGDVDAAAGKDNMVPGAEVVLLEKRMPGATVEEAHVDELAVEDAAMGASFGRAGFPGVRTQGDNGSFSFYFHSYSH